MPDVPFVIRVLDNRIKALQDEIAEAELYLERGERENTQHKANISEWRDDVRQLEEARAALRP